MTESEDRSLSPRSSRSATLANTSGIGSAILSFFKSSKPNSKDEATHDMHSHTPIDDHLADRSLLETRERLSSVGRRKPDQIPRSTTLNNTSQVYSRFYDNIKDSHEDDINIGERRISTIYGPSVVKNGVVENTRDYEMKDDSPIQGIEDTSVQQLNASNRFFNDINNSDHYMDTDEFAPLYEDGEGNLVRPPFINLDPRERYHLLQLKKSMDLSESLERKMKYMIDPNETVSSRKGNTVETATQTHDLNYLKSSLRFNRKRKVSEKIPQPIKKAKKRGFYGGDFTYDLKSIEEKHKKTSHKLDGYLGSVSGPSFKNSIQDNRKRNVDDPQLLSKFGDLSKSSNTRVGLDESLLNNQKIRTTLDPSYVERAEKISNIIKVKDIPPLEKERGSQPSAGFQFNINQKDVDTIINSRIQNDNLVKAKFNPTSSSKTSTATSTNGSLKASTFPTTNNLTNNESETTSSTSNSTSNLFGSTKPTTSSNDLSNSIASKSSFGFSFGKSANSSSNGPGSLKRKVPLEDSSDGFEAANNSFGKSTVVPSIFEKDTETKTGSNKTGSSKPFVFVPSVDKTNKSNKRSEPDDDEPQTKRPMFSIPKPDTVSNSEKPASLFSGGPSSKPFSFNPPTTSTTQNKPSLTFGSNQPSESKADAAKIDVSPSDSIIPTVPSLENNSTASQKPTFGGFKFGMKPTEDKPVDSTISKPAFSFGTSTKPALPTTTAGSSTIAAPVFSFSNNIAKSKETTEPVKTTTPFSFDKPKDTTNGEPVKPFVFGSTSAQPEVGKDAITTTPAKPAFDFGSKAPSSSGLFGSTGNEVGKSPFNFGSATGSQPIEATKPVGFNFGSKESTPGSTGTPKPFNSTSNFKFAAGIQPNKSFTNPSMTPGFGSTPSTFGGAPPTAFAGAPTATFGASNPTPGFGSSNALPNSSSTTGSFNFGQQSNNSSRQATPNFNFGNATTNATNPASVFNQPPQSQPGNQNTSFNFTGINSREGTPNPAQIFGGNNMFNNNNSNNLNNGISMPQPQFGTVHGNAIGNSTPTPPIAGVPPGRMIAKMRKRRNH